MNFPVLLAATIATTSLALSACSGSSTDSTAATPINPASISGELVLVNSSNTPMAMETLRDAGSAFSAEYPNVSLRYIDNDISDHRNTIMETLTNNAPDIVAWFPGNSINPLIEADLLDDVTDIWIANNLGDNMSASAASVTRNGKQWGIPISRYGWGVYYRQDIFDTLGITEPETWEQFKDVAETAATVNTATALSQFFDRDAPAAMAIPAFEAFQKFMLDTTKLDSILMRLDEVQDTAY